MILLTDNIPNKLYHYAEFNSDNKDALLNRYIYLAAASSENDEHEFEVNVARDECLLSIEELFKNNKIDFEVDGEKIENPIPSQYKIVQELRDKIVAHDKEIAGIYCLTDSNRYENMWRDYAHYCLCLEFDSAEFIRSLQEYEGGFFGKVDYVTDRTISIFDETRELWKSFFIKTADRWSSEKEYRYLNLNPHELNKINRKLRFSSTALTGIYCGSAMDENDKEELRQILRNDYYSCVNIHS